MKLPGDEESKRGKEERDKTGGSSSEIKGVRAYGRMQLDNEVSERIHVGNH